MPLHPPPASSRRVVIGAAALAAALALASSPLRAQQPSAPASSRVWVQHAVIDDLYAKFESVPATQRSNLRLRVRALPMHRASLEGVRLELRSQAGVQPLPIDAQGTFELPRSAALSQENPPLHISTPAGVKVALGLDVMIALPSAGLSYVAAMDEVRKAGDGMRRHAGLWAFMMPKPQGLQLRFAPGDVTAVTTRGGPREHRWPVDAQGSVVVPLDPDLRSENPMLVFARPPLEARPYFKAAMRLIPDGEATDK